MKDALTFIDGPLAFTLAPLVACSVAALALIADALIRMATTRKIRGRIGGQVEAALEAGDPRAALDVLISGRPFFTGAANALKAMAGEPKALRDEAASLALAPLPALWRPATLPHGELEVRIHDVGQGQLVELATANYRLLYDTGPRFGSGFTPLETLWPAGQRFDDVIVSHDDLDHAGGVAALPYDGALLRVGG
ncbi:MAG: hypothetical protein ACOC20_06965, partial [Oceanicaulis sp.]